MRNTNKNPSITLFADICFPYSHFLDDLFKGFIFSFFFLMPLLVNIVDLPEIIPRLNWIRPFTVMEKRMFQSMICRIAASSKQIRRFIYICTISDGRKGE
jgi:hypothetical protein